LQWRVDDSFFFFNSALQTKESRKITADGTLDKKSVAKLSFF